VPLPRPTTAAKSSIDLAMQNHQQLMAKFLDMHKNVMMAYLQGTGAGASATLSVSDPLPASLAVPLRKGDTEAPQPLAAADLSVPLTKGDSRGAERPAGGRSAAIVTRETVLQRLVALVSERTGYPEEMLGVDLDLEADLGVDSIKRVEILGALQNESALSTGSIEGEIENLSKLKTLRAIAEWITDRAAGESLTEHPALPAAKTPEPVTVAATIITTDVVIKRLVALVAERTGYPEEMLAVDLDLEADLGVDSIKRVEILGALQNESSLGMSALEGEIENLSKLKTLRAIAEWIAEKASEKLGTAPNSELQELGPVPNFSVDTAVSRLTIELVGAGTHEAAAPLTGIALISNDGVIAPLLAKELSRAGVAAHVLDRNCDLADMNTVTAIVESIRNRGPVTAFIHLSPLAESRSMDPKLWQARLDQDLKSLFNFLRCLETDLRKDGTGRLLVATRLGGSFASGLREHTNGFWPGNGAVCGLVKSVAREWADISSRVVDFEFDISNEAIVRSLVSELTIAKGAVEVGYRDGNRMTLMSVPSPINGNPARIQINRDDVVLITGGARGITAAVAVELARNFQCKLILAGRSPLPPSTEPSNIAGILDPKQLKAALLKHAKESGQQCSPASIEVMFRKISQEREIRSSLAAMAQAGSHVEYHSVDVTDTAAFGSFIDKLYALHGRLDGVIHGAGIIEDKLIRDKSPESFDRVVKPKVTGALVLVEKLRPEALKFLAFFSSVSARYGNRGQGDYAAANEVLNKLAMWLNHRWPGRVLSLNWGPWKTENGMVSSALAAQFAKAGVQLIEPEIGPKIFVRELLFGQKEDAEIIWGGPIFHERPASPAAAPRPTRFDMHYPLLSGPAEIAMAEDGSVVVLRETDPKNDIYLADHQLDGKPVMPMAMTLEFFAEAAAAMNPGKKVVKVGNLKVLRGVTFPEQKPKVFRIQGTPHHDAVDLKLMVGDGRDLHYTASAEILTAHRNVEAPALELVKPARLRMSVPELYENWLFHGPAFAGIEEIAGVGENGIVARLKLSNPGDLFNYRPKDKWLVDPVVIDSGLQLIIVWARHYFDTTPLPSRLGACHVFELPASGNVRCEVKIDHQPGSPTLMTDLKFFDGNNRLFAWLEEMEATCSKALNRLSGSYLAARGTQK
jgi:NAD(P)-dependent dehydrogenase (short-subunit alcohol dehydrogenase family)/acyl carrier protein